MDLKKGDRVRQPHSGMEGTVLVRVTKAADVYGDNPNCLVEWDWKGEKVRTFAPIATLEIIEETT